MIICLNGEFLSHDRAAIPILDHGVLYGDGVFDTAVGVGGRVHLLEEHIQRLLEGCGRVALTHSWTLEQIQGLAIEVFQRNGGDSGRIRITITRGVCDDIPSPQIAGAKPSLFIISSRPDFPSEKVYSAGIRLAACTMVRPMPEVKSLSFAASVSATLQARERGADDAIFVNGASCVTEGPTFNIFAVINGELVTPATGILAGVTRRHVIALAKREGRQVVEREVSLSELSNAEEVFATGTTKRVLGVVSVDGTNVGHAEPGPVTRKLLSQFQTLYY